MSAKNQSKNTLKHQRTVSYPFWNGEEALEIRFSATREQVNEVQLKLGNEENWKDNFSVIHNTLLDWCDPTQQAALNELFNDAGNYTLQLQVFRGLMPFLSQNKTSLGQPSIVP